jgi:hypothetical protein
MKAYRRLKLGMVLFVALVFFGGLASGPRRNNETFPFYSWFLFSLTPQAKDKYAIKVTQYGPHRFKPARFYEHLVGVLGQPHSPTAHKIIQRLGEAVKRGDEEEVAKQRRLLEDNFMPGPSQYWLAEIFYDPVVRYKTGAVEEKRLREFIGGKFP